MSHDTTISTQEETFNKHDAKHDENGGEIGDPTPMQPPLGYKRAPSLSEQIAQQVRIQTLKNLEESFAPETEDEADDFEVGDDYEPLSRHENDHVPTLAVLKRRALEIQTQIREANQKAAIEAYKNKIKQPATPRPQPENNDLTTSPQDDT